jgi:hypothetical protein
MACSILQMESETGREQITNRETSLRSLLRPSRFDDMQKKNPFAFDKGAIIFKRWAISH